MDHSKPSFDSFGLHLAAMEGDDDGVYRAINKGADVNALDDAGRTALMCAVAGEHWQNVDASDASFMTQKRLNAIRLLLRHPNVSLFTLNAPQSSTNGVIPLGMAAWLNMEEAVRLLLEDSADTVSVDGMDTHGATALMYAARDGGLNVVQLLLSHGARPDFRDCNHRTSIQFALGHPQILWLCESILRRHRWRESQSADRNKLFSGSEHLLDLAHSAMPSNSLTPPPPSIFTSQATSRLTDTLIASIISSDLSFLHSLLFSPALPALSPPALYPMSAPILVNLPDAKGWSPIHYSVSVQNPCIDILDALYCAGAEVSLFTTHEHFTPLHILARSARLPTENPEDALSLYHFIVHLICDLRAPLSARDKNDETCIHVAAEHGSCIALLRLLLGLDTTGSIRELRNSRGLTALEIAKPEFRAAFGEDAEKVRSVSSLSTRTIRPSGSFASLVSFSEWKSVVYDDTVSLCSPLDLDVEESTLQLLSNLRATSPYVDHHPGSDNISHLSHLLSEASHLNQGIINQFRCRVGEATKELKDLRINSDKVHILLDLVTRAAVNKLGERGFDACRRRNRDSEDSGVTIFNQSSRSTSMTSIAKTHLLDETHISVATQTVLLELLPLHESHSPGRIVPWTKWLDGLVLSDSSTYTTCLTNLADVERELAHHRQKMAASDSDWNEFASPGMDIKLKQLIKKQRKLEDKVRELENVERKMEKISSPPGTSKLKAWIKRIITQDRPTKIEIVYDIDENRCAVGRQVKTVEDFPINVDDDDDDEENGDLFDARIDGALRTSNVVLNASQRDLQAIEQCLDAAEQFLDLANHSISRAERIFKRAVKKRETMITNLRSSTIPVHSEGTSPLLDRGTPGALGYNLLAQRPSVTSLSSVYSSHSACPSIAPTLIENDDDDTRAIRRLLLRKIEASIVGSWDEMDKVMGWLHIVKEAVRGVKRRAYL